MARFPCDVIARFKAEYSALPKSQQEVRASFSQMETAVLCFIKTMFFRIQTVFVFRILKLTFSSKCQQIKIRSTTLFQTFFKYDF